MAPPTPARRVELTHEGYLISTDPSRIDVVEVHRFLSEESYWALGRSFDVQRRAIEHSHLVIGAYSPEGGQAGFARMVTDLATFAYLGDVYVLPEARGCGLGRALVRAIVEHPDVAGIRRQLLATADAHPLYARFGFGPLHEPDRWMERHPPPQA